METEAIKPESTHNITSYKPPLSEEQKEVNSVAVGTLSASSPVDGSRSLDRTPSAPGSESPKVDLVAKGTIGNQRGRIEFALVHAILTGNKDAAKHDRQMDRIESREERLDQRDARTLLGDQIYFGLLEDLLEQKIVKDEVEYDRMLSKMLMDETFYNNMSNLMEGRLQRERVGRTEVTTDD